MMGPFPFAACASMVPRPGSGQGSLCKAVLGAGGVPWHLVVGEGKGGRAALSQLSQ